MNRNYGLQISGCGEVRAAGGEQLRHSEDCCLVGFVLSGKGMLRSTTDEFEIREEAAFVLLPGEKGDIRADAEDPWSYAWIGMNGILCDALLDQIGLSREKPCLSLDATVTHLARRLVRRIGDAEGGGASPEEELMRIGAVIEFFALLGERQEFVRSREDRMNAAAGGTPDGKEAGKGRTYVAAAQKYIAQHFTEPLRMDELAEKMGITPCYLSHIFRQYNGAAPSQYLACIRVENSKRFLEQTAWPIAEVARKSGYVNALNFSKVFRKMVGCSPATYRRMKRIEQS